MRERRRHARRRARLVLGIDTERKPNRAGLTLDVSPSGVSFRSTSCFSIGEVLKLRICAPKAHGRDVEVFGTVVRTHFEPNSAFFPNISAVAFRGEVVALAKA